MDWYDVMISQAKVFIKKGQSLTKVMFLKTKDELDVVPLDQFGDDKDLMAVMMRSLIKAKDPDEYLVILESWMLKTNTKSPEDQALAKLVADGVLAVSQVSAKVECISVVHGTRTDERFGLIPFRRKGHQVTFEPIQWHTGEQKGRFCGLRDGR